MLGCTCVCVCVDLLKRSKTCTTRIALWDESNLSNLFSMFCVYNFSRGTQHVIWTVSNEATNDMGYQSWPLWRTCLEMNRIVINNCLVVLLWVSCLQAVASQSWLETYYCILTVDVSCFIEVCVVFLFSQKTSHEFLKKKTCFKGCFVGGPTIFT